MPIRNEPWPAGVPCWADLMTSDVEAAQRFYGDVVGWDFEAQPDFGGYVVASRNGQAAAGIGSPTENIPSAWTLSMACDDIDATAAAITEAGGQLLMGPMETGNLGHMLMAIDSQGCAFGAWQAGEVYGAQLYNEPGGITWEDARCADPAAARTFYGKVFGYEYQEIEGVDNEYRTFSLGGDPLGGIGPMWGATAPMWLVYFAVEDADKSAATAAANGGTVIVEPKDTPYGRMSTIADNDAATFAVIQVPTP